MLAMRRQIQQNAAKTHRTETFCDEQVVLFSPPATMHEHQTAHHTPRLFYFGAFLRHLLTDHLPAFSQHPTRIWLTHETGRAICAVEGLQHDAVCRWI